MENKNKEFIPQFVAVGEYSIQDRITGKIFDCRQSSQVRGACGLYKFYSDPSEFNDNITFIDHLYYQRVCEYLVKNKYPQLPNPFDDYNVSISHIKGVKKTVPPDEVYSNDNAKIIVKLFTSNDINIAIKRCKITGKAHERYKEEFIKLVKSRKENTAFSFVNNNDLFNENQDKDSGSNDTFKVLFNVNKADIKNADINKLERCLIHNHNVVHLYQHNYVEYEKVMKEVEVLVNQKNRKNKIQFIADFLQKLDNKILSEMEEIIKRKMQ